MTRDETSSDADPPGVPNPSSCFYFSPSIFSTTSPTSPRRPSTAAMPSTGTHSRRLSWAHRHMDPLEVKEAAGKEFEALPPVVKRKFFSSLERLRLARDMPVCQTRRPPLARTRTSRSPWGRTRWNGVERRASRRLSRGLSRPQDSIDQTDAEWFLALPDKVKSRHFTKEERAFLTGECAAAMVDAPHDAVHRHREQRSQTAPSTAHGGHHPLDGGPDDAVLKAVDAGHGLGDLLHWWEDDGNDSNSLDLQLRLEDYRAHIAAHEKLPKLPVNDRQRRSSVRQRRRFSISRPWERSWMLPVQQAPGTSPPSMTRNSLSSTAETSVVMPHRTAARPVEPSTGSQATYYLDPEARLKLRVYLASPQKFDEAIEFGFPSSTEPGWRETNDRRASRFGAARLSQSQGGMQTFLDDDDASLFFDDDDHDGHPDDEDASSLPDIDQPQTPSELDTTFRSPLHRLPHTATTAHATDSTATTKRFPSRSFDSYAFCPTAHREMTLRLTLTRPDLQPEASTTTVGRASAHPGRHVCHGSKGNNDALPAALDDSKSMTATAAAAAAAATAEGTLPSFSSTTTPTMTTATTTTTMTTTTKTKTSSMTTTRPTTSTTTMFAGDEGVGLVKRFWKMIKTGGGGGGGGGASKK